MVDRLIALNHEVLGNAGPSNHVVQTWPATAGSRAFPRTMSSTFLMSSGKTTLFGRRTAWLRLNLNRLPLIHSDISAWEGWPTRVQQRGCRGDIPFGSSSGRTGASIAQMIRNRVRRLDTAAWCTRSSFQLQIAHLRHLDHEISALAPTANMRTITPMLSHQLQAAVFSGHEPEYPHVPFAMTTGENESLSAELPDPGVKHWSTGAVQQTTQGRSDFRNP